MSELEIPVLGDTPTTATSAPAKPAPAASGDTPAQDTGDQATPPKPEGDKPEEVTPEVAAKREGRRFERRLDKAYRERAQQQARADLLEKRLAELEKPKPPEGKPTLEQFDYDPEKYAAAVSEYAKTEAGKEFEAKQRTEAGKREHQSLLSGWEEKVTRADEKYDDFNEVVGELNPNVPVVAAIFEAENGEDIAYYLGKNPKEAQRIAQLHPRAQIREIGKIEAKLLAEPVKPKKPSTAPEPIKPVGGSASPSTKKMTELTQDEFEKRRRAQIAQRR